MDAREGHAHGIAIAGDEELPAVPQVDRRDVGRERVAADVLTSVLRRAVGDDPRRRVRGRADGDANRLVRRAARGNRPAATTLAESTTSRPVSARSGRAGGTRTGTTMRALSVPVRATTSYRGAVGGGTGQIGEERPVRRDRHRSPVDRQRRVSVADRAEDEVRVANGDRLIRGWKLELDG